MIPVSRLRQEEKGKHSHVIIKIVERFRHDAWHYIFDTLTPYEALIFVILRLAPNQFSQAEIVAKWENQSYRFKLGRDIDGETLKLIESVRIPCGEKFDKSLRILFGGRNWCNVISTIVEKWSPENYFRFVNIKTEVKGTINSYKYNAQYTKSKKRKKK